MRTLKFIVDDQIIKQDPDCDFSGLVPGSSGRVKAEFSFSKEWNGYYKVVAFYSPFLGVEYAPQLLTDGKSCVIPEDALKKKSFKIQVVGMIDDQKIVTNKLLIIQNGGKK